MALDLAQAPFHDAASGTIFKFLLEPPALAQSAPAQAGAADFYGRNPDGTVRRLSHNSIQKDRRLNPSAPASPTVPSFKLRG